MSLYNMINGVNPATFFFLPMLGKHPDQYPRFRDCFIGTLENSEETDQFGLPKKKTSDEDLISVYTRVGGGNREDYVDEIQELQNMPEYVRDFDDDFDSTFATFIFSVPEKWKDDFEKIRNGDLNKVSEEYLEQMKRVFPKLSEKFDQLFSEVKTMSNSNGNN